MIFTLMFKNLPTLYWARLKQVEVVRSVSPALMVDGQQIDEASITQKSGSDARWVAEFQLTC